MRLAALVYGLFVGLLFAPFLFAGEVFIPGDFLTFVYPWRAYLDGFPHNLELFDVAVFFYPQDVFFNQSLKSGVIPLWNPHIFSGHPAIASGQSGFLYPPRILLHGLFSPAVAKTWIQLLHLYGMGLAMNWFFRTRGFGQFASLVGGLVWMGNSHITSWLEFEHLEIAGFYLPLLLVCVEKALSGRDRYWLLMPLLGALSLHSGHLQSNLYTGTVLILYASVRIWQLKSLSHGLRFLAVGVLTVGLSGPTIFPFLEFLGESQRVPLDVKENAASFWSLLLSLLSPDVLGNPSKGFMINRCRANLIYPEFACFVGTVPLVFALAARGRQALVLQVVSVVALLFASASFSLSLPFLSRFVPGRILLFLVFCLTYLAVIGAQQFRENSTLVRRTATVVAGLWTMVLIGVTWLLYRPQVLLDWWRAHPHEVKLPPLDASDLELLSAFDKTYSWNPQLLLPILCCGALIFLANYRKLLLGLTALQLLLFAAGFNTSVEADTLFPMTPEIQAMSGQNQGRVVPIASANYNTLTPYGLSLINGYESLVLGRYATALGQAEPEHRLPMRSLAFQRLDGPILDALSLEYALLPPHSKVSASGWELVIEGQGGSVYRNLEAVPRCYLVGSVRPLRDLAELRDFDPRTEAFVSVAPPPGLRPGAGAVQWLAETSNQLDLMVETETTQLLLLTDAYHKGWKCYVDGLERPVFPTNMASRGVYLEAGRHAVTFRFEPQWFRRGLWSAGLSLAVILLLFGLSFSPRFGSGEGR